MALLIGARPMTDLALSTLIPLDQVQPALVERVLDDVFGTDRHQRTAYRIRAGTDCLPALSFAALDASDTLVGTIQAWPVALTAPEGRAHPLIMVGPVAILPARQGQGFGRALVRLLAEMEFRDLGAHRFWLDVKESNTRALALYRDEGFVEEGRLRESVKSGDGWQSLIVMSMLREEHAALRGC